MITQRRSGVNRGAVGWLMFAIVWAMLTLAFMNRSIYRANESLRAATDRLAAIDRHLPVQVNVYVMDPAKVGPTIHGLLPAMDGVPSVDFTRRSASK